MDWELVKPWVNRVGIMLEFLSFWFAAPEILGEERLRELERRAESVIRALPVMMGVAVFMIALGLGPVVWLKWGVLMSAVSPLVLKWKDVFLASLCLISMVPWVLLAVSIVSNRDVELPMMFCWLVATIAYIGLIGMFWNPGSARPWMLVLIIILMMELGVALVGGRLTSILRRKAVAPLLRVLAEDKHIRRRSLAVGAVLFVVGFSLQLIATF